MRCKLKEKLLRVTGPLLEVIAPLYSYKRVGEGRSIEISD